MKQLAAILIPVVVLGGLIGWRLNAKRAESAAMTKQRASRAGAAPRVSVAVAQPRDLQSTFEATGTLEAPLNVKISAKVSGRVNYLQVHEGDRVRQGQVLVRIDSSQVEADVQQQQANVSEAQYRLAQALINEAPTNVNVTTQIKQQAAGVVSAKADFAQASESLTAQVSAAEATVIDIQGRVDNAQAAIGNAKAEIASAQATLENAQIRRDRVLELYKQGFIAAQDVDDAKAAVSVQQAALEATQSKLRSAEAARDSAVAQKRVAEQQVKIIRTKGEADVEAARQKLAQAAASLEYAQANTAQNPAYKQGLAALKASVKAAQAALASARARRADTVLTSPLDGSVTGRYVDPGGMASAGQPLLAVEFFKQIWVSIAVPDAVSARIHLSQPVTVWFDALPGRSLTASVIQVNPSADPQGRQFTVRAIMSNTAGLLRPGMFAHASLVTEKVSGAITVPREAIETDEAGEYAMVVDSQSVAHRRPVTTGLADAQSMAVTQGLQAGEKVITISSLPIKDGQAVQFGDEGEAKGRRREGPGAKG
jgi:HlyD family secretion protein